MSSSHLIQKINAINLSAKDSKDKREPTTHIFVEGKSDIVFWQIAFENCGLKNFKIRPGVQDKGNGKKVILENLQVAKNLLLCVDSDYDYLLQNTTEMSELINTSDFVFQTYAYSIENLYCYSLGIQSILHTFTDANLAVDFEQFISDYSSIIYSLFLKSVYYEGIFQKNFKKGVHPFSIDSFIKTISFKQNFDISFLHDIENNVVEKYKTLSNSDANEVFNGIDINKAQTYLFIQGHHLLNNIVKPLLSKAKIEHDSLQINELKKKFTNEELGKEIDIYKKTSKKIEELIFENTAYQSCSLYKKIETDIQSYINKYKSLN